MRPRGKRHDGGVSRVCRFCGEVGARVIDIGGYVHRRCLGPQTIETREFTPVQIARYWSKVDSSGGPDACWPWTAAMHRKGYGVWGRPRPDGRGVLASRMAYELTFGKIPDGLFVCHSCDNPPCCNPKHLWIGTAQQNSDDMVAKGRNLLSKANAAASFGENNSFHKLSVAQVLAIVADPRIEKEIAADYGVAKATINHIKSGRNWSKVTGIRRPASVSA